MGVEMSLLGGTDETPVRWDTRSQSEESVPQKNGFTESSSPSPERVRKETTLRSQGEPVSPRSPGHRFVDVHVCVAYVHVCVNVCLHMCVRDRAVVDPRGT